MLVWHYFQYNVHGLSYFWLQAAKERGEKLNKIEEATVQMKTEASEFEELAKRLKNKYK